MTLRKPVTQPKLPEGYKWCEECGGEGIVYVGSGPVEREEQCEECDGDCYVEEDC